MSNLTTRQQIFNCFAKNKISEDAKITSNEIVQTLYDDKTDTWRDELFFSVWTRGKFDFTQSSYALEWHKSAEWGARKHANVFNPDIYVCQCICKCAREY